MRIFVSFLVRVPQPHFFSVEQTGKLKVYPCFAFCCLDSWKEHIYASLCSRLVEHSHCWRACDDPRVFCLQALKQLDAARQAADPGKAASASSTFLQDVLLRRLADDEPAVVTTVLSLPSLADVPGPQLYAALAAVIKACTHTLRIAGRRSEHKAWRAVARKVQRTIHSL